MGLFRSQIVSNVSAVQRQGTYCVRFEVFKAVTMKNGVFLDVTPSVSCKNRRCEACVTSQKTLFFISNIFCTPGP
jgi:hypothetical protein